MRCVGPTKRPRALCTVRPGRSGLGGGRRASTVGRFLCTNRTIGAHGAHRVGDLLGIPGLALRLLAGAGREAGRSRWVHVSELEDPTPMAEGGRAAADHGMGVGTTAGAAARVREDARRRRARRASGSASGSRTRRSPKALRRRGRAAGVPGRSRCRTRCRSSRSPRPCSPGWSPGSSTCSAGARGRAHASPGRSWTAGRRGDRRRAREGGRGLGAAARPARPADRRRRRARPERAPSGSGRSCASRGRRASGFSLTLVDRGHHVWSSRSRRRAGSRRSSRSASRSRSRSSTGSCRATRSALFAIELAKVPRGGRGRTPPPGRLLRRAPGRADHAPARPCAA